MLHKSQADLVIPTSLSFLQEKNHPSNTDATSVPHHHGYPTASQSCHTTQIFFATRHLIIYILLYHYIYALPHRCTRHHTKQACLGHTSTLFHSAHHTPTQAYHNSPNSHHVFNHKQFYVSILKYNLTCLKGHTQQVNPAHTQAHTSDSISKTASA